jgi:hypothetical protein
MGEPVGEAKDGLTKFLDNHPHIRSGLRQTAVLSNDGLRSNFERTPEPRNADSRSDGDKISDYRIVCKLERSWTHINIEPNHPGCSLDYVNQSFPVRQVGMEKQIVLATRANL